MKRILIIDDDDMVRSMLRIMLEEAGYDVEEAADGNIGINLFRNNPHDLILTDIIMPNKEGIETIMELRKDFPDVKIIAMSGGGRIGPHTYLSLAKGLGAQRTLTKPISMRILLNTVSQLVD